MNRRKKNHFAEAAVTLAALSIFAASIAAQNSSNAGQNPGSGVSPATPDNLPAWAYPPSAAGRGGRGGRAPGAGGATPTATPAIAPAGAPDATTAATAGSTPGSAQSA